jgi:hypothetical protein
MYFKPIARITKDHLASHIETYLEEVNDPSDTLSLAMPKVIEISSVIGGVIGQFDKTMPRYAVDCLGKTLSETNEDINTYVYNGQITGIVSGRSAQVVDDLIKAHCAACELFVKNHLYIDHADKSKFAIQAMGFVSANFSGAMEIEKAPAAPVWIAAFDINISWLVSEDAAKQHG